MTPRDLLHFLRSHRLAVQSSVSSEGAPQSAVVGFVVSDAFEILFDTLDSARKVRNYRGCSKASFVVGGWGKGDERTAQIDGVADEPAGADLDRLTALYYEAFPDGPERRRRAPGLTYVRIRPTWIRYSDFGTQPPTIIEFKAADLA